MGNVDSINWKIERFFLPPLENKFMKPFDLIMNIDEFIFNEVKDSEKENEKKECNCCGWDDYGFQHEPICNLFKK